MHLDGNDIAPSAKEAVGNCDDGRIGEIALVLSGIGAVEGRTFRHVIARKLFAVDVDHASIVDVVSEQECLSSCRCCREVKCRAEVVGRSLVAAVGTIVEQSRIVASACRDAYGAVTEGSGCFFPS